MNIDIAYYFKHPDQIGELSLEDIQRALEERPYHQPLHYLMKLKEESLGIVESEYAVFHAQDAQVSDIEEAQSVSKEIPEQDKELNEETEIDLGKEVSKVKEIKHPLADDVLEDEVDLEVSEAFESPDDASQTQESKPLKHALADDVKEDTVIDELMEIDVPEESLNVAKTDHVEPKKEADKELSVNDKLSQLSVDFEELKDLTPEEVVKDQTLESDSHQIKIEETLMHKGEAASNQILESEKKKKSQKQKKRKKKKSTTARKKGKTNSNQVSKEGKESKVKEEGISDFTQWLLQTEQIFKDSQKAEKKKKKRKKSRKSKNREVIQQSIAKNDSIVSEPLADILATQGHYEEAIKMYEQLSLIFPEKSNIFAAKIKKIKK